MVEWHLGTMGFNYREWVGPFYPDGLAARHHLAYFSERLNALEMDSTFYGTPSDTAVLRWAGVTPIGFKICPKMPRIITHEKRLEDVGNITAEFLDRMRLLGDRLGPILLQFPPDFTMAEVSALIHYLPILPDDLRYVIEFRHRSWDKLETAVLLQTHHICWAAVDFIYMPRRILPTTDFLYLRFLGPRGRFPTKDREMVDRTADMKQWRQQIQSHLHQVGEVYGFFNDDYAGFAPTTCNRFKEIVGADPGEIRPMQQGRLF